MLDPVLSGSLAHLDPCQRVLGPSRPRARTNERRTGRLGASLGMGIHIGHLQKISRHRFSYHEASIKHDSNPCSHQHTETVYLARLSQEPGDYLACFANSLVPHEKRFQHRHTLVLQCLSSSGLKTENYGLVF